MEERQAALKQKLELAKPVKRVVKEEKKVEESFPKKQKLVRRNKSERKQRFPSR
jgi:hypothetical protein